MEVKEAYKVLQANCGIEVGDMVRVVRAPFDDKDNKRYGEHWRGRIGNIYRIHNIDSPGRFSLAHSGKDKYNGCFNVPFFCLELVEKAKPELPPIMIGQHEVKFHGDHIEVGCETVLGETLRQILDRLEN